MSLISAAEMAALRGVAESAMTTSVVIYPQAKTQTADGWSVSWPTASETVLGMLTEITSPGAALTVIAGALAVSSLYRLLLPVGTAIETGDQVEIEGTRFTVEHTSAESTHLAALNCSIRRIE